MTEIFNKLSEKEKRRVLRNTMPQAEALLWRELRSKKILGQRFLRQFSIASYVLDFYCPKLRLAIEIDGPAHEQKDQEEYDKDRQLAIEQLGITFLRFKNQEIYGRLKLVTEAIKDKVKELTAAGVVDTPST